MIRFRYAWLALLLCLLPLMSSCTDTRDTGTTGTARNVTLIMKKKSGDYWNTVKMGAEAAAKEFSVNLKVTGPEFEGDVNGQIALIDQAVKEGVDALVLAANDYDALGETVDRVAGARIPVIAIDSEVNSTKVRSFIGIKNYDAGQQAGKKLIQLTGESGRIAVISFGQGGRNAVQREQGLLAAISQYPGIQTNTKLDCSMDVKRCDELTARLLSEPGSIDGIVALDAAASIRVAAETDKTGLAGKVKIVTFDSTPEDIEYLQEGVIQATIIQNPFSMGYLGVKYAVDALDGKKIPEFKDTGTKVIDQENMFWSDNQKLLFPFVK
ncbi:substrate-binding domain-containing protein [Paenibacillus sp. 32352]|uniref:substrate-binding domain-containing protein n=1 Tax=Paenibacillus sp. 32352 TaxID=1969111 RepID=UPI0009AEAAED|nr:substrate-binding domain-containing protein [Paenibacillus sp. 32352]